MLAGAYRRGGRNSRRVHVMDVTDEASIEACVAGVIERFGRLDHAFNNAGVGATHKPHRGHQRGGVRRWCMDVCLKGAFFSHEA